MREPGGSPLCPGLPRLGPHGEGRRPKPVSTMRRSRTHSQYRGSWRTTWPVLRRSQWSEGVGPRGMRASEGHQVFVLTVTYPGGRSRRSRIFASSVTSCCARALHQAKLGRVLRLVASNAGFYSAKNEAAAKGDGGQRGCVSNRLSKNPDRKREQRKRCSAIAALPTQSLRSSLIALSKPDTSSRLIGAICPQIEFIIRHSPFGMCLASYTASMGGK